MIRLSIGLAVLGVVSLCAAAQAADLKVGDPAPAFSMQGTDGKLHRLEDYQGKQAVVIAWFPRAFTGGCTAECKSMRADGAAIRQYDVAYFTASTDDVEKNKAFAASLGLDYPILCDPTGENAAAFGVLNPGKNAAARVTFYIGKDGTLLAIDDGVKTATHGQDIATQLGELGVTKR